MALILLDILDAIETLDILELVTCALRSSVTDLQCVRAA